VEIWKIIFNKNIFLISQKFAFTKKKLKCFYKSFSNKLRYCQNIYSPTSGNMSINLIVEILAILISLWSKCP